MSGPLCNDFNINLDSGLFSMFSRSYMHKALTEGVWSIVDHWIDRQQCGLDYTTYELVSHTNCAIKDQRTRF
jgi:hypothetical protein